MKNIADQDAQNDFKISSKIYSKQTLDGKRVKSERKVC